jgi:hypothetical protein
MGIMGSLPQAGFQAGSNCCAADVTSFKAPDEG